MIEDIREEFLSDLNPEEVPNSDVSDDDGPELDEDAEKLLADTKEAQTLHA